MKLVKTDWRNCLTYDALTDLIRINLHCADIKEFNPHQAIHLWNKTSTRGRRPNHAVWKQKKERAAAAKCDESSKSVSEDVDSLASCSDNQEQNMSDNMLNAAATSLVLHIDGASLFDSGSETDSEFLGFEI